MDAILSALKNSVLFRDWTQDDLRKVAGVALKRDLSPGESLFMENETSTALYVIGNGTIVIKKNTTKGDEETVIQMGTGSHFGELGLLGVDKRTAAAECTEPATVLEIPFEKLEKVLRDSPTLGLIFYRGLAQNLAARIRKTTEDLTGLKSLRLRHV